LSPLLFNIFVRDLPGCSDADTIQFADDVTDSEADSNETIVIERLTESFNKTKNFCESRELVINANKTQFIVFKQPSKKFKTDFTITLDGNVISAADHVKLLGVTLDKHFTFAEHIDKTVKKCQELLGTLQRASPYLPRELLRSAFVSLVRSHLEYASAAFIAAAPTHLKRMDIVQKQASRIICRAPRLSHAEPLLNQLGLEPLGNRRKVHFERLVRGGLDNNIHPAIRALVVPNEGDAERKVVKGRTAIGKRRFSYIANDIIEEINKPSE
jgi:hypothetical protein